MGNTSPLPVTAVTSPTYARRFALRAARRFAAEALEHIESALQADAPIEIDLAVQCLQDAAERAKEARLT